VSSSVNLGSYETHVATSDAKGRFEVTRVVPGDYSLSAERPDDEVGDTTHVVKAKSGESGVRLVLPEVSTLSGRVLLEGKPVPYYGVYITEPEPRWLAYPLEVRSSEGRFAKQGVPAGTWSVTLAGPGFAPKTLKNVSIPDGRDLDLGDVIVEHRQHVAGHVLDANGAPMPGANVTVHTRASSFNDAVLDLFANGTLSTVTDRNGAYQLDGISPPAIAGLTNHIVATHPRLGTSGERELSASESNVDLVIAAAGGIDDRVIGTPGGTQVVRCFRGSDHAFDVTATPDELGQFHFDNLAPGDYTLQVYSSGTVLRPVHVTVTARQRADVVVEIPSNAVTLAVRVDGGCKQLSVKTDDAAPDLLLEATCEGSSAAIYGLPPGPYRLCPDTASCTSVKVSPDPDKQTVEIAARP
jgi:protocatechuate 3,4-dioxygenase beta subunit